MRTLKVLLLCVVLAGCSKEARRDRYFNQAQKYLSDGKFSEAAIQFRNALQLDNNHIPSYFGIADVFKKTGDEDAAIGIYQKIVSLDSTNIKARLEVGRYLLNAATQNPQIFKTVELIAREVLA